VNITSVGHIDYNNHFSTPL